MDLVLPADVFATLMAIALAVLVLAILMRGLHILRRGPQYRRSKPYKVRGHPEFHVYGITSTEGIETFLTFLKKSYGADILHKEGELDEMFWKVGQFDDWVEFHYTDHDGARIRAGDRRGRGLFALLLRDVKT